MNWNDVLYNKESEPFQTIHSIFTSAFNYIWPKGREKLISTGADFKDFTIYPSENKHVFIETSVIFELEFLENPQFVKDKILEYNNRAKANSLISRNVNFLNVKDYNECGSVLDDCDADSMCINTEGSFICECALGSKDLDATLSGRY